MVQYTELEESELLRGEFSVLNGNSIEQKSKKVTPYGYLYGCCCTEEHRTFPPIKLDFE